MQEQSGWILTSAEERLGLEIKVGHILTGSTIPDVEFPCLAFPPVILRVCLCVSNSEKNWKE